MSLLMEFSNHKISCDTKRLLSYTYGFFYIKKLKITHVSYFVREFSFGKSMVFVLKIYLNSENLGSVSLFGVHMFGKAIFSIDSSSIGIKLSIVPIK